MENHIGRDSMSSSSCKVAPQRVPCVQYTRHYSSKKKNPRFKTYLSFCDEHFHFFLKFDHQLYAIIAINKSVYTLHKINRV